MFRWRTVDGDRQALVVRGILLYAKRDVWVLDIEDSTRHFSMAEWHLCARVSRDVERVTLTTSKIPHGESATRRHRFTTRALTVAAIIAAGFEVIASAVEEDDHQYFTISDFLRARERPHGIHAGDAAAGQEVN
ncbi:hypothetical protein IT072_03435 [Leifsonia sp. ZF2019]|uniref:hypothetical protein n=1 Tax=Leifsonia sp. ZF2019 TaxID=2781978 RepID=UPI001CBBD9B3|nr:hypothetical protein [Leifsonia sp. ZF2019]UAJ80116.1 hypothetical protein IT072_03435 [Leifsonia sp. ZF2019]